MDVFGVGVVLARPANLGVRLLRELCEFSFGFVDEHGTVCYVPGIVKCREVPFSGNFLIIDLVADRQNRWCDRCTQLHQRPVKHGDGDKCELGEGGAHDQVVALDEMPDPSRMKGIQSNEYAPSSKKGRPSRTSHPG